MKIGGVEAVRDIKDALELDVDGIIAPMVESKFGAKKFYDSLQKFYKDHKIHSSINIETKNSINQIDEILEFANGKFIEASKLFLSMIKNNEFDEFLTLPAYNQI